MSELNPAVVHQQLQWRYATKAFDPTQKIPQPTWEVLEQSLVLAPSSYGLQPWKFYVVTSQEIKDQLPEFSWNQRQPADCSHFVVLTIKKDLSEADIDRYLHRIVEVRGGEVAALGGFRSMMVNTLVPPKGFDINEWAARQVYIALGQLMTTAAILGVDTCPMEGIVPAKYDELLNCNAEGYHTVVACALGYRAATDRAATMPKVRFATHDVVKVL
ncbi:MAG: NAD(P)H-dependent oxidoreductase [Zavarzinella sp.]